MNARITEAIILLSGLRGALPATKYDSGPATQVSYFVRGFFLWVFTFVCVSFIYR